MTAHQAARYCHETDNDFSYWVWSECVTWGYEIGWASILMSTPAEIEAIRAELGDGAVELPENFNPHVPLGSLPLWAPQDHLGDLN